MFLETLSQVSSWFRYTRDANFCANFLSACTGSGWGGWGGALLLDVEVEVGGEGEVLLLPAVEVHVPAQLGQQQQLARLSTANINTGIIQGVRHNCAHLDTLYL